MEIGSTTSNAYNVSANTTVNDVKPGTDAKATETASTAQAQSTNQSGVIYEPSKEGTDALANKKNNKVDGDMIAKLKADADERLSQLKSIVEQLISKQGKTVDNANMWSQFREGIKDGSIQVDEATAKKAAEDISEDGYWGVKQTSERILDFAKTLAGGDPNKADQMRDAIEKGFKEAAKLWGDELPEISKQTHEAVMKGIEEWKKESQQQNNIEVSVTQAANAGLQ